MSRTITSRTFAKAVACPACGAEPQAPCVGPRGRERTACHAERHEAAITARRDV